MTLGLLAPAGALGAGLVPPPVHTLNATTIIATTKAMAPSNAQAERLRPSPRQSSFLRLVGCMPIGGVIVRPVVIGGHS